MAADLPETAKSVSRALAEYGAEAQVLPEFSLAGADETLRVSVVPASSSLKWLSRGHVEETFSLQVGFVRRATLDDAAELLEIVRKAARKLLGTIHAGSVCISVAHDPLFSPAHLRENGLFVAVLALTFKS